MTTMVPRRNPALPPDFDPSLFGDALAQRIEWTPMRTGGTSWQTVRLCQLGPDRLGLRPAWPLRAFCVSIALLGVVMVLVSPALALSFEPGHESAIIWLGRGIGGLMFFFALFVYLIEYRPFVFDRQIGQFWKGRRSPYEVIHPSKIRILKPLKDIHAIQLVSEYLGVRSGGTSHSHEMNVVLKDGTRVTVMDHAAEQELRADADRLAAFLGVPVWDAIIWRRPT